MNINLIVAVDENNGIGKNNKLPWHLPADLKHFKTLTSGHPIIMGRKTLDSIGKALPNRQNIVISRKPGLMIPGADVVDSIGKAVELCKTEENIFIIGGAQIFEQSIPLAHFLYLTVIHFNFDADTFFPELEKDKWISVDSISFEADDKNRYPYTFIKYRRASTSS